MAAPDLLGAERSALIRAESYHLGMSKGTADTLTAGIALPDGHSLVTRDSDFRAIAEATGLVVEPCCPTGVNRRQEGAQVPNALIRLTCCSGPARLN